MLVHVQLDGAERAYALADFEDLVRAGVVGPETPVRVDAVTGGDWVAARTLAMWRSLVESPATWLSRAWSPPAIPWVTALVCGLCIRVHLWLFKAPAGEPLYAAWVNSGPDVFERGQSWRLLTYGLLHGSHEHLLNNLLFLALVGMALEVMVGHAAVAALFLTSVFVGGVLSAAFGPGTASLGASGGDFGFLVAAAVLGARFLDLIPPRRRTVFGAVLAASTVWFFVVGLRSEGVDNLGHAGGVLAGLAFGAALRPADPVGRRWNRRWSAGVLGAIVVALVALAAVGPRLVPLTPEALDGVALSRPTSWRPGWSPSGDSGWTSPTGRATATARTLKRGVPEGVEASVRDYVEAYAAVDPAARVVASEPVAIDGVPGARLSLAWARDGQDWATEALVLPRGRYLTTVAVETVAADARLRAALVERVLDAAHLTVPEAVAQAEAGGVRSTRGRLAVAGARSDIGDLDGALALLRDAVAAAPKDARVREVLVDELAAWERPEAMDEARRAVADLPEDRRLRAAAAEALALGGAVDEARALLEAGLALAPGDTTLTRALADLDR